MNYSRRNARHPPSHFVHQPSSYRYSCLQNGQRLLYPIRIWQRTSTEGVNMNLTGPANIRISPDYCRTPPKSLSGPLSLPDFRGATSHSGSRARTSLASSHYDFGEALLPASLCRQNTWFWGACGSPATPRTHVNLDLHPSTSTYRRPAFIPGNPLISSTETQPHSDQ